LNKEADTCTTISFSSIDMFFTPYILIKCLSHKVTTNGVNKLLLKAAEF